MKSILRFKGWVVALAVMAGAAVQADDLKPGLPAPALKVGDWIQGDSFTKFEKGQVYVVEFWATWCGPCKTSIPHINELSKKFGSKVKVVGVSVWERGDNIKDMVTKFVAGMGDKMSYSVAMDDANKSMATTWMEAASQNGIPAAFIIDGTGTVAWIGHPMSMDKPLDDVINGKWDTAAFAKEFDKDIAETKAQMAMAKLVRDARKMYTDGKKSEAMASLDELISKGGAGKTAALPAKLDILANNDMPGFEAFMKKMSKSQDTSDQSVLAQFAGTTAFSAKQGQEAAKKRMPCAKLAIETALGMKTKDKVGPITYYYAGITAGESGDPKKAVSYFDMGLAAFAADPMYSKDASWNGLKTALENMKKEYAAK